MARAAAVLLVVAVASAAVAAQERSPYVFEGVERVVAVGDVHGSYGPLTRLLREAGLLDEQARWSGGKAHLVMVGDLIDRNPQDRAVLDLLRRLERESVAAGGRVHVLLGNHEVMNLLRDLRYMAPGSYASFTEFERESERKAARRDFLWGNSGSGKRAELIEDFERRYPPGYFGRLAAFDLDGPYGSWLVERPVIVRINGVLYVHGGLTEPIAELGLSGINEGIRKGLIEHMEQRRILERERLIDDLMGYTQVIANANSARRYDVRISPRARLAANAVVRVVEAPLFGGEGPLWYRGNAREDERIERHRIDAVLDSMDARALVVAHSPTPDSSITSRFSGKLYRVDHGMSKGNAPLALVLEDDRVRVFDAEHKAIVEPVVAAPVGEAWPGSDAMPLDDDSKVRFLKKARVGAMRDLGRGSTRPLLLELELGDFRLRAVFKSVEKTVPEDEPHRRTESCDRYQHEVAAYRLDRAIGLGMVPVTVVRTVNGTSGSAQEFIEDAVDQESVEAYDLDPIDRETLEHQMRAARLFDVLIGNRDRRPSDILYAPGDGIRLIDHSRAFCLSTRVREFGDLPGPVDPHLMRSIAALDRARLVRELGDLLSVSQIAALLERRDVLLRRFPATSATSGH